MFFPQFTRPTKEQVTFEINKVYPGAMVYYYNPIEKDPSQPLVFCWKKLKILIMSDNVYLGNPNLKKANTQDSIFCKAN